MSDTQWHGTTILSVRKGGQVVVVGDGQQERRDFDLVEASKRGAETLLTEIERADVHGGTGIGLERCRL